MVGEFRSAGRILFAPVWWLWAGYRALWWAFEDSPDAKDQDGVTAAPVNPSRPTRRLATGFASTIAFSALTGLGALMLRDHDLITSRTGWLGWMWLSGAGTVISLWTVRRSLTTDPIRPGPIAMARGLWGRGVGSCRAWCGRGKAKLASCVRKPTSAQPLQKARDIKTTEIWARLAESAKSAAALRDKGGPRGQA